MHEIIPEWWKTHVDPWSHYDMFWGLKAHCATDSLSAGPREHGHFVTFFMYGVHRNMTHSVRSISFRVYLIIILKAFVQILVPEKRGSMRWVRLCWVRLKRAEALAGLGRRLYLHYLVECPPPVISAPLCTVQPADGAKYFCQLLPTFVNYCQLLSTFWLRVYSRGLTSLFLH